MTYAVGSAPVATRSNDTTPDTPESAVRGTQKNTVATTAASPAAPS